MIGPVNTPGAHRHSADEIDASALSAAPAEGSDALITSGAVYEALKSIRETLATLQTDVYHVGTSAPDNTKLLWIDTENGVKYYDGSAWVTVPAAYST